MQFTNTVPVSLHYIFINCLLTNKIPKLAVKVINSSCYKVLIGFLNENMGLYYIYFFAILLLLNKIDQLMSMHVFLELAAMMDSTLYSSLHLYEKIEDKHKMVIIVKTSPKLYYDKIFFKILNSKHV